MFTKRRTGAKGKFRPHAYEGRLFDDRRTEEKVAATTANT
jgi:hypothetical protein